MLVKFSTWQQSSGKSSPRWYIALIYNSDSTDTRGSIFMHSNRRIPYLNNATGSNTSVMYRKELHDDIPQNNWQRICGTMQWGWEGDISNCLNMNIFTYDIGFGLSLFPRLPLDRHVLWSIVVYIPSTLYLYLPQFYRLLIPKRLVKKRYYPILFRMQILVLSWQRPSLC